MSGPVLEAIKKPSCFYAGYDVFHWPEVKALMTRLGVEWENPTTGVTIHIPAEGFVRIDHTFMANDRLTHAGGTLVEDDAE